MEDLKKIIENLEYAKEAVKSELENSNCLVDFKGLTYWASEVERLRKIIKENV